MVFFHITSLKNTDSTEMRERKKIPAVMDCEDLISLQNTTPSEKVNLF